MDEKAKNEAIKARDVAIDANVKQETSTDIMENQGSID